MLKEEIMKELENNGLDLPMPTDEYVEEDNINDIEEDNFLVEKLEFVLNDINNIYSSISFIKGNLNYNCSSELEIKEEIFSLLKEIEEKTDIISYKIMKLVNYME